MKKTRLLVVIVFLAGQGFGCLSATSWAGADDPNGAVSSTAVSKAGNIGKDARTEDLLSSSYGKLLIDDTWHVFTAPSRWDNKDWLIAGLSATVVAGTYFFADKFLQKDIQKNRTKTTDDLAKNIEPFGAEYSVVVLGAFELEGYAFNDETAKAVAHDGIGASLIASGIITPALKYSLGRSRPDKDKGAHHFSPFSGDASFPSGHTTQAFAVASVIADHYDPLWVKIVSYGTASLVGCARIERNAHFTSDVLTGALIGTFVGRTVVDFNKQNRYEIMPFVDAGAVGVQARKTF